MKRRHAWLLAVTLLVVIGLGAAVVWVDRLLCSITPLEEQFTEARWATYVENARGGLVMDLVQSKRLDGQTKQAVTTMLGPPSTESPQRLTYTLGGVPCSMTSAFLDIELDRSGRVASYMVRPD